MISFKAPDACWKAERGGPTIAVSSKGSTAANSPARSQARSNRDTIAAKIRYGRQIGNHIRIFLIDLLVRLIAFVSKSSRPAPAPPPPFSFFSSSGFHVLFSAGSALVSTVGRVTFSNASTSNCDRWPMSLTVSFVLSVKCFLEKFTHVAVAFSVSNLWGISWIRNARLGSWFRSLGEQ